MSQDAEHMWHRGHYDPKENAVIFNAAAKMWTTHLFKKSILWEGTTSAYPYVFRVYGKSTMLFKFKDMVLCLKHSHQ